MAATPFGFLLRGLRVEVSEKGSVGEPLCSGEPLQLSMDLSCFGMILSCFGMIFVMFWHEFFMFWHGLRHVAMDFGSVLEHGEVDVSDRCDSCSWERGLSKLPSGNCKLPRGIF